MEAELCPSLVEGPDLCNIKDQKWKICRILNRNSIHCDDPWLCLRYCCASMFIVRSAFACLANSSCSAP